MFTSWCQSIKLFYLVCLFITYIIVVDVFRIIIVILYSFLLWRTAGMQREVFNTISMSSISTCTPFLCLCLCLIIMQSLCSLTLKGKLYWTNVKPTKILWGEDADDVEGEHQTHCAEYEWQGVCVCVCVSVCVCECERERYLCRYISTRIYVEPRPTQPDHFLWHQPAVILIYP